MHNTDSLLCFFIHCSHRVFFMCGLYRRDSVYFTPGCGERMQNLAALKRLHKHRFEEVSSVMCSC